MLINKKNYLTFYFLLFNLAIVVGQEVKDTIQFSGSISLGGARKTGFFKQTVVTGAINAHLKTTHWGLMNSVGYTYTNVNEMQLSDDWAIVTKLRYRFKDDSRLTPTLIHVFKKNLLFRINNSHNLMLGAVILPVKKNKDFWLFIGGGVENTNYNGERFINSPLIDPNRDFGIAALVLENKHQIIKKKLFLNYKFFYLQSLEESMDYDIWAIASLNMTIIKNFTFGISYDYSRRNVHLEVLPSTNDALTFNLKIALDNK